MAPIAIPPTTSSTPVSASPPIEVAWPPASATANANRISATPSLLSDSPSTSVRKSAGTRTRRNAATTATGSVAATIAPSKIAGAGGSAPASTTQPATIAAVASVPGTASSTIRHAMRRSDSRSRFHAASKISGGKNTNSSASPNANGGGT